jgi:hypothetical protein
MPHMGERDLRMSINVDHISSTRSAGGQTGDDRAINHDYHNPSASTGPARKPPLPGKNPRAGGSADQPTAEEIVFTSGGTEADNHAVKEMLAMANADKGKHIVTTNIEQHNAVIRSLRRLKSDNFGDLTLRGRKRPGEPGISPRLSPRAPS